jgi:transcriptional regulator with XRE-family HTH domain
MMELPQEEIKAIAQRAKALRLQYKLTQEKLAERSGVSFGSIKRFENTGKISLESLLKIAFTLDAMKEFSNLFSAKVTRPGQSLDELIASSQKLKRGVKS